MPATFSKIRICIFVISLMGLSTYAFAQNNFMEEYNAFKQQAFREYNNFRDRANAEYVQYMRNAWAWYNGEEPISIPEIEEAVVPPIILPEKDRNKTPKINLIKIEEIIPTPNKSAKPMPLAPIRDNQMETNNWLDFIFYGTPCRVRYNSSICINIKNTQENTIAEIWGQLIKFGNSLLLDCLSLRDSMCLCDWAYVKLTELVASELFGKSTTNEAVIVQSFILNQSGYKIHIARSKDEQLHMLIAAECDLYNYPYWVLDDEHFYLIDGSNTESLAIYTQSYPKELPMRMTIEQENRFAEKNSSPRSLQSEQYPNVKANLITNENLIDFYNNYPASYINNDPTTKWRFYAQTPLSQTAKKHLYPILKKSISGKNETEAANILLNFVQTAFAYEYDNKIWGQDRTFFAEETLYYPYSDCEDRSVLFSRLIQDLLHLDIVLIYYPGHLATAVRFNEMVEGDYIEINGKHYTICDPTYIYASIGMTMPDMDNSKAIAIML